MSGLELFLILFLDTLVGHIILAACLFPILGERITWERARKLPVLLFSPLIAATFNYTTVHILNGGILAFYDICSFFILIMCSLWVRWSRGYSFGRSLAVICMGATIQVAISTSSLALDLLFPLNSEFIYAWFWGAGILICACVVFVLYKVHFGTYFTLLLEDESHLWRTVSLLFALELIMEAFFHLENGIQPEYMILFSILLAALVTLMVSFIIHLAKQFDATRKMEAQRNTIAQQQLYEQDLEEIRREVRSFRHDYKNLLSGMAQQAGEGELEALRKTLEELDVGFDRRLGEKIQFSTQIGNLQIPQVRSILLSKLAAMRDQGISCRLEVLYPLTQIEMDVWDYVRCLGILLDNAMEAALETKKPWVEILLLQQGGYTRLRVSNPWNGQGDPAKMWQEGYSTKGSGRGIGLAAYQRILRNYGCASYSSSWADQVFIQELILGK
ncbi:MAG: GHKL domain-containing protein [Lachnospiraceae bacterium]|nr:GHKL domain-containing protein [Lachnospiraceae bacterium]